MNNYTLDRLRKCLFSTNGYPLESIDEDMIPIITELNERGYYTTYCCQGHPNNKTRWSAYISFNNNYDFPINVPLWEYGKSSLVKHYSRKLINSSLNSAFYYWFGSKSKKIDQESERKELMNTIYKWACSLPKRIIPKEESESIKYYKRQVQRMENTFRKNNTNRC